MRRRVVRGFLSSFGLVLICAGLGGTARAELIHDEKLGFTLTVPDGFVDFPAGKEQPGTAYAYLKGTPGTDDFAIITIKSMGGTIGREALERKDLPKIDGIKFDLRRDKWKSFDIDVMVGTARQEGIGVYVAVAQVPLKREAVEVVVAGPEARKAEVLALLRSLLASLDGPSNWLTDGERSTRLGEVAGGLVVALACAGTAIWLALRRLSPRKRPPHAPSPGGP
jgi:hypothetical protein